MEPHRGQVAGADEITKWESQIGAPTVLQTPPGGRFLLPSGPNTIDSAMAAEVALEDLAVGRAVEHRAPRLELAHAIGRFLGVDFRHAPVVHELAAAHGVAEVNHPIVIVIDVTHGGSCAAFCHNSVGFTKE